MPECPFVLYVVPTFNRAHELPRTLTAIALQRWPNERMSILVIDNGSTDDTGSVLTDLASRLPCKLEHFRKAPEGPTVARNIGLRRAGAGLVAFVDSDVELDPGWTVATVSALEAAPTVAQVGGKLVFAHDPAILNNYGGELGWLGLAWDGAEGHKADSACAPREVLWINTAAVLMRPAPALAADGFDEAFYLGYEEPDLGWRLAIAGWRSLVVPDALALHHTQIAIGVSSAEHVFHYTKNRFRMGFKALGLGLLPAFILFTIAYGLLDALLHSPRGARLRALTWNLANLRATLRLRARAQAGRTVSDRHVLRLLSPRPFPPQRLKGLRRRPFGGGAVVRASADDRVGSPKAGA